MALRNVFIDGTPLISKHLSGVGHVVLETVRALDTEEFSEKYRIKLFIPIDEKGKLDHYNFQFITPVYLPFPHKFLSLFSRLSVSPPLDLFLGKGIYIFPNFRNWPLLFSKSITYIHDVAFTKYPEYIEPRNLKFLSKHTKRWIRQTDSVVAISETTQKELEVAFPDVRGKVTTIVNAVDTRAYKPQDVEVVKAVKQKYSLTDYVFFVSNIEPRKNIPTLIEGFNQSLAKEGVELFLVGGMGWLNEPILAAIKSAQDKGYKILKNQSFVPDEDLPALMQGARVVVVPSWHEGFGLPLIQAAASGSSVIASDIPALREAALSVDKGSVAFFNPSKPEKLAELLRKTHKKSDKELTVHRSAKVTRTWNDAAKELEKLMDDVYKEKK